MISAAVIGGGVSGLNAAYRLAQQNVKVTLFEASARPGGIIQSERSNEYLVEYGPSSIEGLDSITAELLQDLDLAPLRTDAHPIAKKLYIVRRGKTLAVPLSVGQFLSSSLISPLSKLRLLQEPFIKPGNAQQEESVAAFMSRRLGQEVFQYIVSPFVTSVLAGNPTQLSAQHAFSSLYQAEQRYGSLARGFLAQARVRKRKSTPSASSRVTFSFQEGLQTLSDALYTRLQEYVHLNTPVIRLQQSSSGWLVTTSHGERIEECMFDAVISTTPLYKLPIIIGESAADFSSLHAMEYPPLSILALGFQRNQVAHPLDGLGMLIPAVEHLNILGTLFSSTVYPARAPEGHVLLTTFIGGASNPEQAKQPIDKLLAIVLQELGATLGITGQPTFIKHIYLQHSLPQYQLGHNHLLEHMAQIENHLPGFFMAGNYRQGVSVRDALRSGHEAAERLIASKAMLAIH